MKPDASKMRETTAKRKQAKAEARKRPKAEPDWDMIEQANADTGKEPKLTFAPSAAKRAQMVAVLERKPADPERRKLQVKLTREFVRIYKRYRRMYHPTYLLVKSEEKHAAEAARLCILKGVTPRQLIEYWHANVGNFTGMRFPTLSFLAVAGNVDRVSVEDFDRTDRPISGRQRTLTVDSPKVHAYGESGIDKRLRPGLESAGIDTTQFSDRQLMTVQSTAQAVAAGHNLFISSKLRPMIKWAVKHLYKVAK